MGDSRSNNGRERKSSDGKPGLADGICREFVLASCTKGSADHTAALLEQWPEVRYAVALVVGGYSLLYIVEAPGSNLIGEVISRIDSELGIGSEVRLTDVGGYARLPRALRMKSAHSVVAWVAIRAETESVKQVLQSVRHTSRTLYATEVRDELAHIVLALTAPTASRASSLANHGVPRFAGVRWRDFFVERPRSVASI